MKKPPARKASAVSPLPQNKKGKAGRIAQKAGKPLSAKEERVAYPKSEKGYELAGRKKIPFERIYLKQSDGAVTSATYYGSQDASDHSKGITLLVKHEMRGGVSWGGVANGLVLLKGRVTNKLQAFKGREVMNLFLSVESLRLSKSAFFCDDAGNFHLGHDTKTLIDLIMRDIVGGSTHNTSLLAKCIEAAAERELLTKRERIYNALIKAANQLKRIPTKREVQQVWEAGEIGGEDGRDSRNFEKELKGMGLDWLPASL